MIAERLIKLRAKKKKTQQEMADAIGVTRPAYTAYESGNRKPDYETLNKIVDVLDTNSDYLLGRTDDPSPIVYNDADSTIALLTAEAHKMGLEPSDPKFLEMLENAFKMLRIARGQDEK